jgi:FKBP-type peptidyl-prolyl cis-trans isomerase
MSIRPYFVVLVAAFLAACGSSPTAPSSNAPYSQTDLRLGTGAEAVVGRVLTVHYTGWLYDDNAVGNRGAQFDSSLTPGRTPFTFVLGAGSVISGWERGMVGMRVGGQRRLVLPPDLAYGSRGSGNAIPPNATLLFEVELLGVQ